MKTFGRRLSDVLLKEIHLPGVVVLTGMRQVGKTTLLKYIFDSVQSPSKVFLDLENPINQKVFEEDNFDNILVNLENFGFVPGKKSYVCLDEIQLAPRVVSAVKYLYDKYKIKFFLTGSSSFYLKNLFPESLAGRKVTYELFPLDFQEFLVIKGKERKPAASFSAAVKQKSRISCQLYKKFYEEYLDFGGFPAVVLASGQERKRRILEDIFKSYFEKDVRVMADFKDLGKLRDFIVLLAARAGSKIEISNIASDLGLSRETIYSYLGFLEKTYFVFLLSPYARNTGSEVRGAKKVYFCDNGLLNYASRVSGGSLFENAVFHDLRKYGKLNYYEKYKGGEIDFILDKKIAFEVKTSAGAADLKRLSRQGGELGLRNHFLITREYCDLPRTIPAQDL